MTKTLPCSQQECKTGRDIIKKCMCPRGRVVNNKKLEAARNIIVAAGGGAGRVFYRRLVSPSTRAENTYISPKK